MKQLLILWFLTNVFISAFSQEIKDSSYNETNLVLTEENVLSLENLASEVSNLKEELDVIKRLKITGYVQPQWQYIQTEGAQSFAGGNFSPFINNRFMMRRGRVKFTYEHGNGLYMLNTDWTEKGVNIRETYAKIIDPWTNHLHVSLGLRQYQFGHDITYSSGDRETPERARMFQILFPTERDLMALFTLQPPKTSPYSWLKVDFAVCNGSGVASEFDKFKDITARVSINKSNASESFKIGFGLSYLNGGYRKGVPKFNTMVQDTKNNYTFITNTDSTNIIAQAPRNYIGADLQISNDFPFGINIFRAEYIKGVQTGTSSGSVSPIALPTSDLYQRNFNGLSLYLIQTILQSRHQLVLKYDYYDPNTKVSGVQIGVKDSNTKAGDVKFTTWGIGWNYRIVENVKVTFYYDVVKNETTALKGFTEDLKDNVYTFRMQFKY